MSDIYDSLPLTSIAATVLDVLGVNPPEGFAPANDIVTEKAEAAFGGKADRVFIYNPDAVALWLFQKYTGLFKKAMLRSDLQIPMLSVMPSVTPVCFASMYTGVMPESHGIKAYVKPVLKAHTVFDSLARAGKRCAIVSTSGDSISEIFRERDMDYFIYDTHQECKKKALELIAEDRHSLIVLYNGNYDATMHKFAPESKEALAALEENVETFSQMHGAICSTWKGHKTLMGFCPDHGCHEIDGGMGSHGLEMIEDMNIIHMFSFIK